MRHRCRVPIEVLVVAATVMWLGGVSSAGQGPSSAPKTTLSAKSWTPPKTPWGDPDLQGIWSNATITPLERPKDLAGKEFLTEEEVQAREKAAIKRNSEETRGETPDQDVAGAYNFVWWDRGTKVIGTRRTSLIVDPPDGRIPWSAAAQKENAERDKVRRAMLDDQEPPRSWLDVDTGERCITDGIPWTPGAYNNNYQIVQGPGYVGIVHEMFREMRVIPVNASPQPHIPQWFGTSRGHWEGNTLVVETANFADKSSYVWANKYRRAQPSMHLVERFTRADSGTLLYEFTITDPAKFTGPWTAQIPMTRTAGQVFEYACHEGNYAVPDILNGGRVKAQEKSSK